MFRTESESGVILVETPSNADVTTLTKILAESGARSVVLTSGFAQESSAPERITNSAFTLVVGIFARPDPRLEGSWILEAPIPPRKEGVRVGALIIPPAQYGVHRTQLATIRAGGEHVPTLEAAAADLNDGNAFYVRFPGGPDGIAHLGYDDIIAGRIPRALILGRTVLVGDVSSDRVGLTTPLDPSGASMKPLDFHAFALQTLLSDRVPRPLPTTAAILLIAAAALMGTVLYVRTAPRVAVTVAIAVSVGLLIAGLGALIWINVMPPVAELLTSQALVSLLIWRWRETAQDRTLRQLTHEMGGSLLQAGAPAVDAATRLAAVLELERSLVLVRDGKGRTSEALGTGLAFADLPATLREGDDPVFEEAARTGQPALAGEGSGLYVMPLVYEGRLVGYWLMLPSALIGDRWPTLEPAVLALSSAVARLVARSASAPNSGGQEKPVTRDLATAVDDLRGRIGALETALDRSSTAIAVRDLLSTPGLTSPRFRDLVATAGLDAAGTDPVELIRALTGVDENRAAELLRLVLVDQSRISVPVTIGSRSDLVLRLSSLAPPADLQSHVLFEIADLSEAMMLAHIRKSLGEQLDLMIRNDLEAVLLAATLLGEPGLTEGQRNRVLDGMGQAVQRARARMATLEPFMSATLATDKGEMFPIDLRETLGLIVEDARALGQQVKLVMPEVMAAVVAAPEALGRLLRSMLAVLAEETAKAAPTVIVVSEDPDHVIIDASAPNIPQGYVMSDARLQSYLSGARPPQSAEMRDIVKISKSLSDWGGRLEGTAAPGAGLRFVLTLRKLV